MAKENKEIVKEFQGRHFGKPELAVSADKIKDDKAYLMRVVRTGIELESANIPAHNWNRLKVLLGCDGNYNELNHWAERCYEDGSISPEGQEIVFKGSSECFDSYHAGLKATEKIIKSLSVGAVNNDSTSAHITLLTAQNREIPEAYLANYYQLYRKFCDCLLWLSSATWQKRETGQIRFVDPSKDFIVRGGINQYASPLMTASPLLNRMVEIYQNAHGKYVGMYLKQEGNRFLFNGNPNGLLVEFRFIDRIVSPIALTAFKCLLQAMLFKAVELSEFGILNLEAQENSWAKTKAMVLKIANGTKLTAEDRKYLTEKSLSLIEFVYPNLRSFDGKSVAVLKLLASKPISQRYRDGDSDDKIEKDLTPAERGEFKTERELRRIIQLQLIKAEGAGEWAKKAGETLAISERMVRHTLTRLGEEYNISFDKDIGSYILVG